MDHKQFQEALDSAKLTRYSFAKQTGMQWRTVDGYYNGTVPIKKKTEAVIRLLTGYKDGGEKEQKQEAKAKKPKAK